MTRDKTVHLRLTQSEYASIEKAAEASGLPVAVFIRAAAIKEAKAGEVKERKKGV